MRHSRKFKDNIIIAIASLLLCAVLFVLLYDGIVGGHIMQTILDWIVSGGKTATEQGENFADKHNLLKATIALLSM